MDFGLNPEESSTDLLFVVCARCGEERPKSAFRAKRQSAGQTKQCIDCRNQRVSHHSRSKVVLQTLRNIALRPSSPGRPATKRTDGDAGLSPPNERSGTQPTSPEKLRQLHTARSLFGEPISQPQVVLGTPIPPTQQSLRNFRTLAPSPTVQPTTNQIAFHKGGKDSQDDASKAEAKARQVAIQRDHRSRRRAGETVSLTPSISQLGVSAVTDEPGGADRLGRPVVQIKVNNVGPDSHMHWRPSDADIQPLAASWLCNGARGTVYDIGWAPGADPIQDSPCVIMMEFDKYNGPVFLTTPDGKKIVPILSVERDFLIGATFCARTQFPLIVCYAITVHKSQSITEDMIVTDLSCQDFQTGLSYVAVSRVETLEGLMLEAPFDRNHLVYGSPPDGMKMKMRDQELRKRQVLTQNPYMSHNTKNCHGNRSDQTTKGARMAAGRRLGPLGKVHNISIHMRENDYRWNEFKKRAGRSLGLDNDTRWNSWFLLLDTTLNLQSYVEWYQKKYYQDLRDDYLTPDEWSALGETRAFLQPFWKITQLTEGRYATLDRSLFTMDVLHKHYTQAFQKHSGNATLRSCVAASWAVFDKYYQLTDESPARTGQEPVSEDDSSGAPPNSEDLDTTSKHLDKRAKWHTGTPIATRVLHNQVQSFVRTFGLVTIRIIISAFNVMTYSVENSGATDVVYKVFDQMSKWAVQGTAPAGQTIGGAAGSQVLAQGGDTFVVGVNM
ncbi:hypothetical protein HZS61_008231 [Fusarium oxysporum f. sp. conglutinans]|uniref:ATP-dependent DNA helicase PIF1 n=1 Tax=Fusarium oxysporum f. sp. conglutinans TaxID=100902 RepID=A0A8H6LPR4_FUSOX|nr:hypothetical protein HZS61_008231 [Fusarium oxysporum f. sp. conglutinans]